MPFDITATREFAAAHQIKLYHGSLEPLHGHNWKVKVTVTADALDDIGLVMDFHELQRLLDAIIQPMHNAHLNEVSALLGANPTTENVALHIAEELKLPRDVQLRSVEVWETSQNSAVYRPTSR
jgi:6-pyruvoyltetrahydropterin/6-carboxytetrahydropterin synthase